MSDPSNDPQPREDPAHPTTSASGPTLEYRSNPPSLQEKYARNLETLRGVCGAILSMLAVLFLVAYLIASNFELDVPRPPGPWSITGPLIAAAAIFTFLICIAVY